MHSVTVCRPVLNQYVHTQEEFQSYAKELFELVQSGALRLSVHKEYDLSTEGIRQAQEDISELHALFFCSGLGRSWFPTPARNDR